MRLNTGAKRANEFSILRAALCYDIAMKSMKFLSPIIAIAVIALAKQSDALSRTTKKVVDKAIHAPLGFRQTRRCGYGAEEFRAACNLVGREDAKRAE